MYQFWMDIRRNRRLLTLVACAFMFSLPLVAIIYQAVSGLNVDTRSAALEQEGIAVSGDVTDLLLSMQKLRGLSAMAHRGVVNAQELTAQLDEVRARMAKLDGTNRRYGQSLNIEEDWQKMRGKSEHFLLISTLHSDAVADREFAEHTKIIQAYKNFLEEVVDKSGVNTDPSTDSNIVADVVYNLLPDTIETMSKLRDGATRHLATTHKHSVDMQEQERLEGLYNQMIMMDAQVDNRLHRGAQMFANSQSFVDYHDTVIQPKLTRFMERYEQMLFDHHTEWTPQSLFAEASDIIQNYDALGDEMVKSFAVALEGRSNELAIRKGMVLLSTTVGMAGFILIFVFLFRTLTKAERAELEATNARNTAVEAAAAKSDFLANMSHELRTPMNGVLGMASLLAETKLDAEQGQYVATINSSGENLLMLLNDILDVSKIEAGVLTLEHIAYDFQYTIKSAGDLLRAQADKKGIALRVECAEGVPQYLWGDSGRMRQVVTNLIGNAIKFTSAGHVHINAALQEREDGSHLYVSVEDTGIGIPANKLNEIFEKFTQADATITRKYGGTGLGLAITRQLVALMGGTIGVESAEGKGSTFWFRIPCQKAAYEDIIVGNEPESNYCSIGKRVPIGQARVLLVEDYPVNRVFAEKLLQKFGFQHIDTAEDGIEAMALYSSQPYDIIFMDCQMPKMDGYLTTTEIRIAETLTMQHVPIIAMTANAMIGDREKCLTAGMDDYVSKPLRINHLKHVLERWFELDTPLTQLGQVKPEVVAAQDVPVDLSQLRMFTGDDPEEERALVTLFLDQSKTLIQALEQSTGESACDAWKSVAHRFKGSAANLGAFKLQHLCKRAEEHFTEEVEKKSEMLLAIKAETLRVEQFFPA